MSWKENIPKFRELLEGQTYRNGARALYASYVGTQFFCEQKVELEYQHGEISTEDKQEGFVLHKRIFSMEKTTIDKLIHDIEKKKICVVAGVAKLSHVQHLK